MRLNFISTAREGRGCVYCGPGLLQTTAGAWACVGLRPCHHCHACWEPSCQVYILVPVKPEADFIGAVERLQSAPDLLHRIPWYSVHRTSSSGNGMQQC